MAVGLGHCAPALVAFAQSQGPAPEAAWIAADPDRPVLRLPHASDTLETSVDGRPLHARSYETAGGRVHIVEFEGRTYGMLTEAQGPYSRIVFDPSRRKFEQLLPSIRVEVSDAGQLESIASALGATGVTHFGNLGFAIVKLPATLDPAEALSRVTAMPGQSAATVRLAAPPLKWR